MTKYLHSSRSTATSCTHNVTSVRDVNSHVIYNNRQLDTGCGWAPPSCLLLCSTCKHLSGVMRSRCNTCASLLQINNHWRSAKTRCPLFPSRSLVENNFSLLLFPYWFLRICLFLKLFDIRQQVFLINILGQTNYF